jgi:iron(III) transport system permease protein
MPAAQVHSATSGLGLWLSAHGRLWRVSAALIALLVALPIVLVLSAWLQPQPEVWRHLADTVLAELLRNTAVLMLGVGLGVVIVGVGLAWLTVMYEFPGRGLFEWALVLPLAMPAYVLAFVAVGLFDFSGPVQTGLRALLGAETLWFPPIRSQGGVIAVLTLAFYPYVYMLARAAFMSQGHAMLESGRVLGLSAWGAFRRVALPMARPAIAAGTALALMEALADFGAVTVFNYDTFTTAIYKAWFGLFNLPAAAQLASLLLLFVGLALYAERRARGQARYHAGNRRGREPRYRLKGWRAAAAFSVAALVLGAAFVLPVAQLLVWAVRTGWQDLDSRYFDFLLHTVTLGAAAALITVMIGLLIAYVRRTWSTPLTRALAQFATLGYALPGSVLAVGSMLLFVWLDRLLSSDTQISHGVALGSGLAALLFAYVVRFLAVSYGPLDSALERIRPSIALAARSLGASQRELLWRVYLPILRPGLLSAALLVLVEVMKEMPATLLLRPFGWDTLALRIFEMTSEGEWERAALPALTLVLVGLLPVALLVRRSAAR